MTGPRLDLGHSAWTSPLPFFLAERAVEVAVEVGRRVTDPDRLGELDHDLWPWIATGDAGIALLCGQLGWDRVAHEFLTSAVRKVERYETPFVGLFEGLGGIAFAANALSLGGTRYQRLLAALSARIAKGDTERVNALVDAPAGPSIWTFDVISGVTGTGAYFLSRLDDPQARETLESILTGLVALCAEQDGLPHWYTPPFASHGDPGITERLPMGNLNCGLSHGIAGPIALLALASRAGVTVPGQREGLAFAAEWLAAHRVQDDWGVNWPMAVPLRLLVPDPPPPARRSAWCYGSPGVARSLWLAGTELGSERLQSLALEAMAVAYERPFQLVGRELPGLCHGIGGLLQITLRFAHDTGDPLFATQATRLTERLLDTYDAASPFGYGGLSEHDASPADKPELLDGAAGVALALLAAGSDVPPAWDRLFLLS